MPNHVLTRFTQEGSIWSFDLMLRRPKLLQNIGPYLRNRIHQWNIFAVEQTGVPIEQIEQIAELGRIDASLRSCVSGPILQPQEPPSTDRRRETEYFI